MVRCYTIYTAAPVYNVYIIIIIFIIDWFLLSISI